MNKKDFIIFKYLSNIYVKLKQKKIHSLDLRIIDLQNKIQFKKQVLEDKQKYLNKLNNDNNIIKVKYNNMLSILKNGKKVLNIENDNYCVSAWENVFIKKKILNYTIETKSGQEIYTFDKTLNAFIEYFITFNYSIVVLSIDKNRIVLDFRIIE